MIGVFVRMKNFFPPLFTKVDNMWKVLRLVIYLELAEKWRHSFSKSSSKVSALTVKYTHSPSSYGQQPNGNSASPSLLNTLQTWLSFRIHT